MKKVNLNINNYNKFSESFANKNFANTLVNISKSTIFNPNANTTIESLAIKKTFKNTITTKPNKENTKISKMLEEHQKYINKEVEKDKTKETLNNLQNELELRFKELLTVKDNATREIMINRFCKELKITKSVFKQSFKEYTKKIRTQKRKELAKKFLSEFNEKYELPDGFEVDEQGILKHVNYTKDNVKVVVICDFFVIKEEIEIRNDETKESEVAITIKTINNKEFLLTASEAINYQKLAKVFGNNSLFLDGDAAKTAVTYITAFKRKNENVINKQLGRDVTGWSKDLSTFYLPNIETNAVWVNKKMLEIFTKKGKLEKQIEMLHLIGEKGTGRAFLVILLSLCAPLLKILDIRMNVVMHVGGKSGKGKTLISSAAFSLFGNPEGGGITWNTTLNGLEVFFEENKDIVMLVDELNSVNANDIKTVNKIIEAIYNFANGKGKQRAYISGENGKIKGRDVKKYRGVLISTGEEMIKDIINKAKSQRSNPLGLTRRLFDFNAEWLFEGYKETEKREIYKIINSNHGIFIGEWIKIIKKYGKEEIEKIFKKYEEKFDFTILKGRENYYYLMFTVLKLLYKEKLIIEQVYKKQYNNILEIFDLEQKDITKQRNILIAFLEALAEFVTQNNVKFIDVGETSINEIWGVREGSYFHVLPNVLEKICENNGLVKTQVVQELYKNNLLVTEKERKTTRKRINNMLTRVYAIDMLLAEDKINKASKEIEIPF